MDVKELIDAMAKDVKDDFMLQAVFNRHIYEIEKIKTSGVAYKRLLTLFNEKIESEITDVHFRNLIFRAKKKLKSNQVETSNPVVIQESVRELVSPTLSNSKDTVNNSLKKWRLETNIDMPERMIERLESNGFTPQSINELGLTTVSKISKYLTRYEHTKGK